MQFSKSTPSLIYINMPEVILYPTTPTNKRLNIALTTSLRELKIPYLTSQHLITAAHIALADTDQRMPHQEVSVSKASKARRSVINRDRTNFVDKVLRSININFTDVGVKYSSNGMDITTRVEAGMTAKNLEHRQTWMNGINSYLADTLSKQAPDQPIAFIATDPRRLIEDKLNPVIGLLIPDDESFAPGSGQELRIRKKADAIIPLSINVVALKENLTTAIDDFTELRKRADELRHDLSNGRIKLEKQFERDTWPNHALMTSVKEEVRLIVQEVIEESNVVCDALDLEYQTLFRLTSLPMSSVFKDGEVLEAYLREQNVYNSWRDILTLNPQELTYLIKKPAVKRIIEEQLLIIRERINSTTLPLGQLLQKRGIFAEPNWKLQKYGGRLTAIKVKPGGKGEVIDTRKVTFKTVDINYAKELHSTLHYIHTPRATKAFGLFLEDDPLPFSVVAFDTIDRPYKKDLLFMHGYDPSKCLDLARLYSRPGTPFNTSSTIFTLAFSHFKENEPEVQAILSAFMPTYAHGMSMISAGFNYGVLVKEWRHSFIKREINGEKAWELVTKRRKDDTQVSIDSQWPLLPVFELMANLQPPRFTPFSELKGMMISRNL